MQIVNARNRSILKANDDVTLAHTTFSCGTIIFERDDENPAFNREVVVANNATRQRHVLSPQTDIAATDFAIANETARDELGSVDRSGKADSLFSRLSFILFLERTVKNRPAAAYWKQTSGSLRDEVEFTE